MFGSGLQLSRTRGEDRFYDPRKARRNYQNQHYAGLHRPLTDGAANRLPSAGDGKLVSPGSRQSSSRRSSEEPAKPVSASIPDPVVSPLSNLELFLAAIRPSVTAQYPSKARWRTSREVEFHPYFVLGDLWESFKEWSAYGAGVPLILNESNSVVQYYVPYLSAIQIYGESKNSSVKPWQQGDDSDGEFRDSSSDGSCDFEPYSQNLPASANTFQMDRLSLANSHTAFHDELSSDESDSGATEGSLLFEYFEREPPYSREPLANKIYDLSRQFPDLMTLRSCDLLHSSWVSVAWYPIYRIPTGPTLRDLDACFLTFHYLHTPMQGFQANGVSNISLPVFGLASYKFKGSLWSCGVGECELGSLLFNEADNWLRLLRANHPDFLFFSQR